MKNLLIITTLLTLTACAGSSENIAKAQSMSIPLVVNHITVGAPDAAEGMPVYIGFTNTSTRAIKYIDFEVQPFNRYGDAQRSDIGGKSTTTLRFDGRLVQPGQTVGSELFGYARWERIWYNSSIYCVQLRSVAVTYLDNGTWKGSPGVSDRAQPTRGC